MTHQFSPKHWFTFLVLCLLVLPVFPSCQTQRMWSLPQKNQCSMSDPNFKKLWHQVFEQTPRTAVKGCLLLISRNRPVKSHAVELTKEGILNGWDAEKKEYTQKSALFSFPKSEILQEPHFLLYILNPETVFFQDKAQEQCSTTMMSSSYRCEKDGDCWFHFRLASENPEENTSFRQLKCQYFPPPDQPKTNEQQEQYPEKTEEKPTDASTADEAPESEEAEPEKVGLLPEIQVEVETMPERIPPEARPNPFGKCRYAPTVNFPILIQNMGKLSAITFTKKDGNLGIAIGTNTGIIGVWKAPKTTPLTIPVLKQKLFDKAINALAINPTNLQDLVASGIDNGGTTIKRLRLKFANLRFQLEKRLNETVEKGGNKPLLVRFHPDGKSVLWAGESGNISRKDLGAKVGDWMWDAKLAAPTAEGPFRTASVCPKGASFALSANYLTRRTEHKVYIYPVTSQTPNYTTQKVPGTLSALVMAHTWKEPILLYGTTEGKLFYIKHPGNPKLASPPIDLGDKHNSNTIKALAVHSQGYLVAVGSGGTLSFWDLKAPNGPTFLSKYKPNKGPVDPAKSISHVAISHDKRWIAFHSKVLNNPAIKFLECVP